MSDSNVRDERLNPSIRHDERARDALYRALSQRPFAGISGLLAALDATGLRVVDAGEWERREVAMVRLHAALCAADLNLPHQLDCSLSFSGPNCTCEHSAMRSVLNDVDPPRRGGDSDG